MHVFESIAYLEPTLTLDLLNPTDSGRMYAQRTYFSSKRASPLQVYNIYHIESLKAKGFTILLPHQEITNPSWLKCVACSDQ